MRARSALALVAAAACSSSKSSQPSAQPDPAADDPPIEEPVVVMHHDVGAAMHTQAIVFDDFDAWCKQRPRAPCSRVKTVGDEPHRATAYRRGNELALAIATMNGMATAATPIRLPGDPDAIDVVVTRTDGGIPTWHALLTVHQGTTWFAQACSWSGDPEGCSLPITSQTAAPALDGAKLAVRGASMLDHGKPQSMPDDSYVMFVP
jgi:hypothetical protein